MRRISLKFPKQFYFKVNFTKSCWLWTGSIMSSGYGQFKSGNKTVSSHRFAWECCNGEIPEGLFVLHKCDNKLCVNPHHHFLGTHRNNMDDMMNKGRSAKGEKNANSKLTQEQVDEIRKTYQRGSHGEFNVNGLAKKYGVIPSLISKILSNKRWVNT